MRMQREISVGPHGQVLVELKPYDEGDGERWLASVEEAAREQWSVTVATGESADDALHALAVALNRFGKA